MSWLDKAWEKVKKAFGGKNAGGSTAACPLAQTGLAVVVASVDGDKVTDVQGATVDIKGKTPFSKRTDDIGLALFQPVEPDTYTIKVKLPDNLDDTYVRPQEETETVSLGNCPTHVILVERCARPKIKLQWQDTKRPVGGVGVRIPGTEHDFRQTAPADGIAQLKPGQPGIKPGSYSLDFTLKSKDLAYAEVVDSGKPIKLPSGCRETFTYEMRKTWVEFVISDQFNALVSDMEYTLTFPDGKTVRHGRLKDGKVQEEGPPGQYGLALKFIHFAAWEHSPLVVDEPVKLVARLNGYEKGTDVVFDIYDACGLSGAPLDTVKTKVADTETAEAAWTPVSAKLAKVTSGSLVLMVRAGQCRAISQGTVVMEKRKVEIKRDNKPVDTRLLLYFTDGHQEETTTAKGEAELRVPLGRDLLWVDMPDMPGARVSLEHGGVKHEFAIAGEPKA